jgi:predicted porin
MRARTLWPAAAAVLAFHAHAIELYGALVPLVERVETRGATQGGKPAGSADPVPASAFTGLNGTTTRMVGNTTHWGLRVSEALGGGVRVSAQLESGFQIDSGQLSGAQLFNRNSAVALDSRFGRVLAGIRDTPYKSTTITDGPVRAGISPDFPNLLGNPGFGVPPLTTQSTRVGTPADAAFDRRQGNALQYWSPHGLPVKGRLMIGLGEARGAIAAGGPAAASIDPRILSVSLETTAGPLSTGVAFEQHDDYFGLTQIGGSPAGTLTNPGARDRGVKVFAQGRLAHVRLLAVFERLRYENDDTAPAALRRYERDAAYLLVQPRFGNHSVWLTAMLAEAGACARNNTPCSTSGLGARQFTAGWSVSLSRRTDLFAVALRLRNKAASAYSVLPPVATAAGADVAGIGAGLIHSF